MIFLSYYQKRRERKSISGEKTDIYYPQGGFTGKFLLVNSEVFEPSLPGGEIFAIPEKPRKDGRFWGAGLLRYADEKFILSQWSSVVQPLKG